MKIQVISDLHREFGSMDFPVSDIDVLVLAGDIDIGTKGITWLNSLGLQIPVIYILGNHEYYKGSYPRTLNKIKEYTKSGNIHVLENEYIDIGDVRFHGTTLWTDFSLFGPARTYGILCQDKMNDYKRIRKDPQFSKLRSIDTYEIHQKARFWLEKSLKNSTAKNNIVVTHHAPSIQSVPTAYKDDPISSAYASDLEEMIHNYQPHYWIHGHIHTPCQYKIGNTTVICNPHGYIDEPYNGYQKELIIEL
ncbi:metallophosphoesterase [Sphingobacterium sp. SGR-19]|uniref:metallophosphoesterase n=1 Tax=Sphingobacterium sp. SGR-19 TaxID=2710886 RepID=UPI0013EA48A4|nr:metallophosphoesterase [Sphingobacterium sp. SGR-19]NGM65438.1 phosphoesterase [Sphingobacterium sp. SGR-19]